jgi:hypothetical protein
MGEMDIESLVKEKKTPNIKYLKSGMKRMYSDYSEIAHSASPKTLSILGRSKTFTPLYPIFDKNSYVALQHMTLLVCEFYLSHSVFLEKNFINYDRTRDTIFFENLIEKHQAIFGDGEWPTR